MGGAEWHSFERISLQPLHSHLWTTFTPHRFLSGWIRPWVRPMYHLFAAQNAPALMTIFEQKMISEYVWSKRGRRSLAPSQVYNSIYDRWGSITVGGDGGWGWTAGDDDTDKSFEIMSRVQLNAFVCTLATATAADTYFAYKYRVIAGGRACTREPVGRGPRCARPTNGGVKKKK